MFVQDLYETLNKLYDFSNQESFDNSGSQVFFPDAKLKNIIIATDIDSNLTEVAISHNCNAIITHHPVIFSPLKNISDKDPLQNIIISLIQKNISLISVHTNLDKKLFYVLADTIFQKKPMPFITDGVFDSESGYGSIIELEEPLLMPEILKIVKERLRCNYLLYSGRADKSIRKVACINGSGSSFFNNCISAGVDCFITGDVKYHFAKEAELHDIAVIDAGHFETEKIFKKIVKEELVKEICERKVYNGEVIVYENEQSPLKLYTGEK